MISFFPISSAVHQPESSFAEHRAADLRHVIR
jgi:hypothetical protein